MPEKYHIHLEPAPPKYQPVGKHTTVEFREDCAGSCRRCVKKKCIYGIFTAGYTHMSSMKEPEYLYTCMNCMRCVQECTKGIFSRAINPDYKTMGDTYWTPQIIQSTWAQAHTGAVPVSGAGYRGKFAGEGFDSIWTDMSEIVRPTRDGIHGREYINTCIELSRRLTRLTFDSSKNIVENFPPVLEIPLPILFMQPDRGVLGKNVLTVMANAAFRIDGMFFIKAKDYGHELNPFAKNLIPCISKNDVEKYDHLIRQSRMVELDYEPGIKDTIDKIRTENKDITIAVGILLDGNAKNIAVELVSANVDTIHLYADKYGREINAGTPRHIKDSIRDLHTHLVENNLRLKINIIVSGGIAMAEHVAKTIICGADGVAIDYPLLLALECRLCNKCTDNADCPVKIGDIDIEYGTRRIINLVGAWRNQLLEVMGAMGLRESRRLRGETGRAMWFEDLEKEHFGPIFGDRKVSGLG